MDVNALDMDKATSLHFASNYGNACVAEVLLEHGARCDAGDIWGQTPLHRVSQSSQHRRDSGNSRVALLLFEHGADVNARDQDQATPLHLATYYGDVYIAEALPDHGALANVEDIRGQTPLHQVLLGNHDYYQGSGVTRPWSQKAIQAEWFASHSDY